MTVTVQGARPKNILDLIHETISTLIKDSFEGVEYDFYIPCPDCLDKKGTRDPFLFKAELINRAHNGNAPFLQCTKYFHTVSIGQLMNLLPDNKETELDLQIQQSISALQEISSNMAKDVAILYHPDDLPLNGEKKVDPKQIYKDLVKAGFSCWIPSDVDKTSELEMTMEIKNSKVLVVCISEKFAYHPKCYQMFMYSTEQLKKPFAVAVIGESLDWQQMDIGKRIGNPKMAMIKNVERYPKKILDLIDIVKSFVEDAKKADVGFPPVFVSYCWSNSREACGNTTQPKEGSLGYGDPRALKKHLEKNGIRCWLDVDQMGKFGLYQDITVGLQNAKVLVVCVSDEYLESEACMMEARFGCYNLQLPMVVCVVGTGKAWKLSEVSLMVSKQGDLATVVKMQKKDNGVYDKALEYVRKFLERPETAKQKKIREKLAKIQAIQAKMKQEDLEDELKQQGDTKFSFQEEIELIQRRFLRHITKTMRGENLATELPKLLVFDFLNKASTEDPTDTTKVMDDIGSQESLKRPMSSLIKKRSSITNKRKFKLTPAMNQKAIPLEEEWQEEEFCIRALCEDEQGWHIEGNPLSLSNFKKEEVLKTVKTTAPYLARIFAILKQSAISLNCLSRPEGEHFVEHIRKIGVDTKNFNDAYKTIHKMVAEHEDHEQFITQLNRCYLQTGKISWLCSVHHNKAGVTLLPAGTANIHGSGGHLLFEEDILLAEYLQESKAYLAWKGEGALKVKRKASKALLLDDSPAKDSKREENKEEEVTKKEAKVETPPKQEVSDKTAPKQEVINDKPAPKQEVINNKPAPKQEVINDKPEPKQEVPKEGVRPQLEKSKPDVKQPETVQAPASSQKDVKSSAEKGFVSDNKPPQSPQSSVNKDSDIKEKSASERKPANNSQQSQRSQGSNTNKSSTCSIM